VTTVNAPSPRIPASDKTIVLAERWSRYRRTGELKVRNELIVAYSPLVKYIAGRMASRMPAHVELADLISSGLRGLVTAVERFDSGRGIKFESYAGARIRGAIIDELRRVDWVPRSVRRDAKAIEKATVALRARLQRTPTEPELAAELSMNAAQLAESLRDVAVSQLVALDLQPPGDDGIRRSLGEHLPDPFAADPADLAEAKDLRERIGAALKQLPAREQFILAMRYDQELTNDEIGTILGVTGSRVSQLNSKATLELRALLGQDS
jgi:RNA polymerase sigma factor for flagellar operon FliA